MNNKFLKLFLTSSILCSPLMGLAKTNAMKPLKPSPSITSSTSASSQKTTLIKNDRKEISNINIHRDKNKYKLHANIWKEMSTRQCDIGVHTQIKNYDVYIGVNNDSKMFYIRLLPVTNENIPNNYREQIKKRLDVMVQYRMNKDINNLIISSKEWPKNPENYKHKYLDTMCDVPSSDQIKTKNVYRKRQKYEQDMFTQITEGYKSKKNVKNYQQTYINDANQNEYINYVPLNVWNKLIFNKQCMDALSFPNLLPGYNAYVGLKLSEKTIYTYLLPKINNKLSAKYRETQDISRMSKFNNDIDAKLRNQYNNPVKLKNLGDLSTYKHVYLSIN